jgi:acyl-CoA thioesterase
MFADDRASQALGITITDVAPGHATVRMRVSSSMVNGHRLAHGGYIFFARRHGVRLRVQHVWARRGGRNCEIAFVRPVLEGDELTAVAGERLKREGSGIYDVSVFGGDAEVVAEMRGHSTALPDSGAA